MDQEMPFADRLAAAVKRTDSITCVGLDPRKGHLRPVDSGPPPDLVHRLWVIQDPGERQGPEGTPPCPVLPEDPEAEGAVPYRRDPDVPPHGDGGEQLQGSLCEFSMLRWRTVGAVGEWR